MSIEVKKNKYKSIIDYSEFGTASIFKLFSEYFNSIISDKKKQDEQGVKILAIIRDKHFSSYVRLEERYGDTIVLIEFNGVIINMTFEVYKQSNEVYFHINITSQEETFYESESFYKKMLTHAIESSQLKGSIFSMPRNELEWNKVKKMEKRGFDDIFLPKTNIEDLNLYINVGVELEVLMRYLMVGNPGTGKTEATTVLSNILNAKGVTVIKTVVCDKIKEKFDLAQLLAPSIVILDDIDLSLGSRNKGVHPERLQDFLDILDGTEKLNKNVGIIATTNSTALLDMAAQRPGRFDKILLFNSLTRDNIKNIILKSLRDNFKIKSKNNKIVEVMTNPGVINTLYSKGVTGAYVYNNTKMLKLKIDMMKLDGVIDVEWIISEIEGNIQMMNKIKNIDFLGDKLTNNSSTIGFEKDDDDDYDDDYEKVLGEEEIPDDEFNEEIRENMMDEIRHRSRIMKQKTNKPRLGGLLDD